MNWNRIDSERALLGAVIDDRGWAGQLDEEDFTGPRVRLLQCLGGTDVTDIYKLAQEFHDEEGVHQILGELTHILVNRGDLMPLVRKASFEGWLDRHRKWVWLEVVALECRNFLDEMDGSSLDAVLEARAQLSVLVETEPVGAEYAV